MEIQLKDRMETNPWGADCLLFKNYLLTRRGTNISVVNEDLLKREGDVLFLQQSLTEIQSVIKDELKVKNEREHISAQIIVDLNSLGQGWTEERINEFELSELEKKEIQEFYDRLSESRQNENSSKDKLSLHREQKETNKPDPKPPLSPLKLALPYGLIGVGVSGMAVGGIWVDYVILSVGIVMVGLGALLRNKILVEIKPEEEPVDNLEVSLVTLLEKDCQKKERRFFMNGLHGLVKEALIST